MLQCLPEKNIQLLSLRGFQNKHREVFPKKKHNSVWAMPPALGTTYLKPTSDDKVAKMASIIVTRFCYNPNTQPQNYQTVNQWHQYDGQLMRTGLQTFPNWLMYIHIRVSVYTIVKLTPHAQTTVTRRSIGLSICANGPQRLHSYSEILIGYEFNQDYQTQHNLIEYFLCYGFSAISLYCI